MSELTRRYVVMAMATEAPFDQKNPEEPFVLKPWKDGAALRALRTYRDACYPELARELDEWISTIEAGPTLRGDVGRRNDPYVARGTTLSRRRARKAPARATRVKAKRATPRAPKKRHR